MQIDFLQTILENPEKLVDIPTIKDIDPITHDFDSKSISDRLYSLYSVLVNIDYIDDTVKNILQKYEIELRFLRSMNRPKSKGRLTPSDVQKLHSEMISKLRERKLSNLLIEK